MLYKIRTAETGDAESIYQFICQLEETSFDKERFTTMFEANINHAGHYYLVATEQEKIIGFISCHIQQLLHHCAKVAEIQELFVEEAYRKSGVGKLLVHTLEQLLLTNGCINLEVTAQNKRLQTHVFYEQLEFKGTHKKFVKQLS
ncbi:GNAT family N-acetyltransferase [Ferruginibacter sp.]